MKNLFKQWKQWAGSSLFRIGSSIIGVIALIGIVIAIIQDCSG